MTRPAHHEAGRYDNASEPEAPTGHPDPDAAYDDARQREVDTGDRIIADAIKNFREQFARVGQRSAPAQELPAISPAKQPAQDADLPDDEPHIVSVVYGDGNQLYLRSGELTCWSDRATVYANEELADAEAERFAALKSPNWVVIFIGAVSLQKIEDGPSDSELGW